MKNETTLNRINSLTSLRFFMMIMIVLSHFEFLGSLGGGYNVYDLMLHNANMAVGYFFVLSGFGLTMSAYKRDKFISQDALTAKKMFQFAWSKIKKIYPLYLITMLVSVPYTVVKSLEAGRKFSVSLIMTLAKTFLAPSLLQSATGLMSVSNMLNGVGWFLSCIALLYFVYPYIEKINIRYFSKKPVKWFLGIFASRIGVRILLVQIEKHTFFDNLSYGSPYFRVFDFILGILVCDIFLQEKQERKIDEGKKDVYDYLECSSVIIALVWFFLRNSIAYGMYANIKAAIDVALACNLVWIFAHEQGIVSKLLNNRILVRLGNISMYIFLIHYPIKNYLYYFFDIIINNISLINLSTVIGTVIITVVFSFLCDSNRKNA